MKLTEEIKKEDEEKAKDAPLKDSRGQILKAPEVIEDTVAKDSYGRVIPLVLNAPNSTSDGLQITAYCFGFLNLFIYD